MKESQVLLVKVLYFGLFTNFLSNFLTGIMLGVTAKRKDKHEKYIGKLIRKTI